MKKDQIYDPRDRSIPPRILPRLSGASECMEYTLCHYGMQGSVYKLNHIRDSKLTKQCKCMAVLGDSHLKAHCLGWYYMTPAI